MKILTIVGARPQFIKAAVLSPEFAAYGWQECLVHTGQHYDIGMSQIFFEQLSIPAPRYSLEVGSSSHAVQTGEMMKRLEPVVTAERPDWVVVYGDTNTTLAGALVATKSNLPLAHVEAGLRSFKRTMPEEVNRIVTDHIASLHFAPTETAVNNLKAEGIQDGVELVGDVMADLVLKCVSRLPEQPPILQRFSLKKGEFALATVHRAANTDDQNVFAAIIEGFRRLKIPVVFPVHPRSKPLAQALAVGVADNIKMCEPLSYLEMLALQRDARVVLTDSGGVQKEAYLLGIPCVTLRFETEWPETLANGWNVLAGNDPQQISGLAMREKPTTSVRNVFGDGTAAKKIAQAFHRRAGAHETGESNSGDLPHSALSLSVV